jgi:hypothetical protein
MLESMMSLHRCEDCPIRCQAAKKPRSIFARLHRWHMRWWPGWQIYLRDLRAHKISPASAASD